MAPVEKSEGRLGKNWDKCITNALIKTTAGVAVGGLFTVLFFKRKAWPVALGGGVGFGLAIGNCNHSFRTGWRGPPWANKDHFRPGKEEFDKFREHRKQVMKDMKTGDWTPEEMIKLKLEVWDEMAKKYKERKAAKAAAKEQENKAEEKEKKAEEVTPEKSD